MPTQLFVSEKARVMARQVYALVNALPESEKYNLADQMRRSATSVVSNLAEGSRRIHKNEKRQLYSVAYGSAAKLEAQLNLVSDVRLVPERVFKEAMDPLQEVLRLTNLLLRAFR